MLESFYTTILHLFHTINYTAVFIMMSIEASVIPFPSEIPMLAVGIQSSEWLMNPVIGLFVALAWVFVWTTFNYLLGYYVGDIFIERYGKYFFIKKEGYHHVKDLFREDANFYTFFGRLLPVVRQLISVPAGMAHMPYGRFITLSLTGSALWLIVLIALGYVIGDNQELIKSYIGQISAVIIICVVVLWVLRHYRKNTLQKNTDTCKNSIRQE